jgi:hypothetical protein
MKKMIVLMSLLICTTSIPAQMVEDFESNTWGWSESVQKDGQAIITEGVMMLVGKNEIDDEWSYKRGTSTVLTSCYAPFDPTRDFTYKCVAKAKAINNKGSFAKTYLLMIIAAKIRNNMFHGTKGPWELKENKELFKICNELLMCILEATCFKDQ